MSTPHHAPTQAHTDLGNENSVLVPNTGNEGHGWVSFDLPGVRVGTAEYDNGPTGATVIALPQRSRTAVDRRGGAAGLSGTFPVNDAICLAGGSTFGLAATTGVLDELLRRQGHRTDFSSLPVASGAVVYDFAPRSNAIYPDAELGRAALTTALPDRAATGRVGAGVSATVGKALPDGAEYAGQGVAFGRIGAARILILTIVNAIGVIVDREGHIVRGNLNTATGLRTHSHDVYQQRLVDPSTPDVAETGNTTLTVVITNVDLDDRGLKQLATQVHSSMHRAIQPFHTIADGDTLYAVTTSDITLHNAALPLATLASQLAWDAVLTTARPPLVGRDSDA